MDLILEPVQGHIVFLELLVQPLFATGLLFELIDLGVDLVVGNVNVHIVGLEPEDLLVDQSRRHLLLQLGILGRIALGQALTILCLQILDCLVKVLAGDHLAVHRSHGALGQASAAGRPGQAQRKQEHYQKQFFYHEQSPIRL